MFLLQYVIFLGKKDLIKYKMFENSHVSEQEFTFSVKS